MSSFFTTFIVVAGVFALGFVLINLRYVVTGKEFHGTCASNNPMLADKVGDCTVCGKKAGEECKSDA